MAPRSVALALLLAPGARALLAGVQRKDPVAQACPEGYAAIPGDVGGWDQFGREQANIQATMQACADDCEGRKECLSFEWGPTTKICSLNHDFLPNMGPLEDYTFCQKALVRPYRRPTQAPVAKPPPVPFSSSKSANLLESTKGSLNTNKLIESTKGSLDTSKQLIESPQAKVKRAVSEAVHAAVADNQSPTVAKAGAEAAAKAVAAGKTVEEAKAAAEGLWKKAAPAGAAAGNRSAGKNATAERAAAEAARGPAREESAEVKLRREAYKTRERYGYAPGAYSVKFERVPVTRRQARDSQIVGWLQEGSHIEVSEVAKNLQGGRVRGKIEEPHGWISLAFPESKMYYVEKQ